MHHEEHGAEGNRDYIARQALIAGLDPAVHLRLNADGLPVPTDAMPRAMLENLRRYFASRNEDAAAP